MASFTRDWDESNPTDATYAYEIDEYNRYLRVDCSDRLKAMVYGFTAGENDGLPGFKKLTIKQQSTAAATPNADEIVLYSIDDGANCGLYAKNEDGYTKQILKKSGTSLLLNVEDTDIAGTLTFADNTTFTTGLTTAGITATGDIDIGSYELKAQTLESDVATGTAPMTIASTTKVTNLNADKVDGYDVAAYSGGESGTIAGGIILKQGRSAYSGSDLTVTFGTAFPTACKRVIVCAQDSAWSTNYTPKIIGTPSTTSFVVSLGNATGLNIEWIAMGY